MELIPNWKESWKFTSQIIVGLLTIFDTVTAILPQLHDLFTPQQFASINAVMGSIAIVARVVRQYIPVTEEVKEKLIEHAAEQPVKQG